VAVVVVVVVAAAAAEAAVVDTDATTVEEEEDMEGGEEAAAAAPLGVGRRRAVMAGLSSSLIFFQRASFHLSSVLDSVCNERERFFCLDEMAS